MKNRTKAQTESEALEALRLHNTGMTERQIAEAMTDKGMPISQATVHRRIELALSLYVVPQLDEAKKQALTRYETLLQHLSAGVSSGDVPAIKAATALQARIDAITGIDKPKDNGSEKPRSVPAVLGLIAGATASRTNANQIENRVPSLPFMPQVKDVEDAELVEVIPS